MLLQFENEKTNRTIVTQMNRPTPEFSSLFAWASSPLGTCTVMSRLDSESEGESDMIAIGFAEYNGVFWGSAPCASRFLFVSSCKTIQVEFARLFCRNQTSAYMDY